MYIGCIPVNLQVLSTSFKQKLLLSLQKHCFKFLTVFCLTLESLYCPEWQFCIAAARGALHTLVKICWERIK